MMKATLIDSQVLDELPKNEWFTLDDVDGVGGLSYKFINVRHRLERLEELGYLQSKIVGEYPKLKRHYRTTTITFGKE